MMSSFDALARLERTADKLMKEVKRQEELVRQLYEAINRLEASEDA